MTPHLPNEHNKSFKGGGSSKRKEGKGKDLNSVEEEDEEC